VKRWREWRKAISDARRGVCITICSVSLIIGVIFSLPQQCNTPSPPVYTISGDKWTLQQDYTITVSDLVWTVKAGFNQWDGLSIPDKTTNALTVTRYDYPDASLFHDSAFAVIAKDGTGPISQDKANACLRLILLADGCASNRAELIERMVSAWGYTAIRNHTQESVAKARGMVYIQNVR